MPRGLSIIGQIALSVAFVMVAILLIRTAHTTEISTPGFDLNGKIVVKIDAKAQGRTTAQAKVACDQLAERLKGLHGIESVGWSRAFPVGNMNSGLSPKIMAYQPGAKDQEQRSLIRRGAMLFWVSPDFFDAMDIPLFQGHSFGPLDDRAEADSPVIIDRRLAFKLDRDRDVLDHFLVHGWENELDRCRVVGVVPNLHDPTDGTTDWVYLYLPIPSDQVPIYMHVRTSPHMEAKVLESLTTMIHQIDPHIKVVSLTSLAGHHRNRFAVQRTRVNAQIITLFGTLAMFLAGLGLYAVKAYMVATRTREIGVRMALGASRHSILALVFRQNGVSALVGLVLGILLAIGLTSLVRGALYGISPMDPVSIAVIVLVMATASLLAGYVPACRAVRIDPMEALRYE